MGGKEKSNAGRRKGEGLRRNEKALKGKKKKSPGKRQSRVSTRREGRRFSVKKRPNGEPGACTEISRKGGRKGPIQGRCTKRTVKQQDESCKEKMAEVWGLMSNRNLGHLLRKGEMGNTNSRCNDKIRKKKNIGKRKKKSGREGSQFPKKKTVR